MSSTAFSSISIERYSFVIQHSIRRAAGSIGMRACLPVLLVMAIVTGCTTDSHYRDRHTKVTVKRFIGIPYLEKEEKTETRPVE